VALTGVLFSIDPRGKELHVALLQAIEAASRLENKHVLVAASRSIRPALEALRGDRKLGSQVKELLGQIEHLDRALPKLRRELRDQKLPVDIAPPKLRFHTLGQIQIVVDEKPLIDWQAQLPRDFAFYLLAHPKGLTKEQIGLLFWPDCSPAQLKMRFKKIIYRLRRTLGQEIVVFAQDRYWFNQKIDYEYDADVFLNWIQKADHTKNPEEQIALYQKALDLYRGPYLPGMDADWVLVEREKFWRSYAETAIRVAKHYLKTGEYEQALNLGQRVLDQDRCTESAHRLIMRAYARQALEEELGIAPSPQTVKLFQTLTR
jgi:LuxR family maltose regulon positive regulatory protein